MGRSNYPTCIVNVPRQTLSISCGLVAKKQQFTLSRFILFVPMTKANFINEQLIIAACYSTNGNQLRPAVNQPASAAV